MIQPNVNVTNVGYAVDGFVFIVVFLFGVYITWRALASLKWDKFMFDPFGRDIRILRFLLSLVGGFLLGLMAALYMIAIQLMKVLF